MSWTVDDLDRLFDEGFDLHPSTDYDYHVTGNGAWSHVKWQELDNLPTELGVIKYVDDYGGEGQGDDYWVVVKVIGHDGTERYFRRNGWYQSYSGGELDGPTVEVRPREKMVTVYE